MQQETNSSGKPKISYTENTLMFLTGILLLIISFSIINTLFKFWEFPKFILGSDDIWWLGMFTLIEGGSRLFIPAIIFFISNKLKIKFIWWLLFAIIIPSLTLILFAFTITGRVKKPRE